MAKEGMEEKKSEKGTEAPQTAKNGGEFKLFLLVVLLVMATGLGWLSYVYGPHVAAMVFKVKWATEKQEKKRVAGPILSLDPFVFNISGSSSKFAKIALGLEVKDAKVMEETKQMVPAIRDKALSVLCSKGPDVLMDVNKRDIIKKELHDSFKGLFKDGHELNSVYITDIIIQ